MTWGNVTWITIRLAICSIPNVWEAQTAQKKTSSTITIDGVVPWCTQSLERHPSSASAIVVVVVHICTRSWNRQSSYVHWLNSKLIVIQGLQSACIVKSHPVATLFCLIMARSECSFFIRELAGFQKNATNSLDSLARPYRNFEFQFEFQTSVGISILEGPRENLWGIMIL